MSMLRRKIIYGEKILNHSNNEVFVSSPDNTSHLEFGIVEYSEKKETLILGYFEKDLLNNVLYMDQYGTKFIAMNVEALGSSAFFNNFHGYWANTDFGKITKEELQERKGSGNYPYECERLYESHNNLNNFNIGPTLDSLYSEEYKKLIKYTFGLEYETTRGYIPQEDCYRYGLIPLRDGSISGVEYASIILSNGDGFERITKHLELLKGYTDFSTDCSYHIHLGGFPLDSKAIYVLYTIWGIVEKDLAKILPPYAFETHKFKRSQKNYCRKNPTVFNNFGSLYRFMTAGNVGYAGDLFAPHPFDEEQRAKWHINERYWAQNLIGMCFFESPKTVEYRMLAPTHNPHKLILWIYIFNAIMTYAEKLTNEVDFSVSPMFYLYKKRISLEGIISEMYPNVLANRILDGIKAMKSLTDAQVTSGDFCGASNRLDDEYFQESIIRE